MARRVALPVGLSLTLIVAAAGLAIAQPGGSLPGVPNAPRVPAQPGAAQPGVPGGPGGPGGQPGNFDPRQFIDRLMQGDANGDGKLARSEVPPQFAERNFDRFDTDGDGFLDRAELDAGSANLRGGGGGAGRPPLGRAMNSIGEACGAIYNSALNASTKEADLRNVQLLQEGFLAAKFHAPTQNFPADVLAHFGGDAAEARAEFREHLMQGLALALELEEALMEGDADAAIEVLGRLSELETHGHGEFIGEED